MAVAIQEAIKRLRYVYTSEGADKVAADMNKVGAAHGRVAVTSQNAEKATLSLEKQFGSLERRYNQTLRAQQDYERVQRQVNAALVQNPALQARANQVLALAAQHYDQTTRGQRAFATAMQAANDNVRGFVQSAGPLGGILAALGPGGVAAAAGVGAAAVAVHQMVGAATALAERAGKLKDFSETTGFTVLELQALEKAGAQVGVSSDSVARSLERFSVQMAEVRLRTGETYEKLLQVNPELARQVATAGSLQRAYELVAKAIKETDLERANQIARAVFGRGGVEQTRLLRAVADAGGLKGVVAQMNQVDAITAKQAERWDELGDKIAENMKAAKQNIASIFTEPVLEAMERFSKAFLDLSREMKNFQISENLQKVIDFFSSPVTQGAMAGALAGSRGGLVGAGVGAVVGGGAAAVFSAADAADTAEKVGKLRFEIALIEAGLKRSAENMAAMTDPRQIADAAGAIDRLQQRVKELNSRLPENQSGSTRLTVNKASDRVEMDSADRAAERAAALERERQAIIGNYNEMQRWMAVIGQAATMSERYELQTKKLGAAKAAGAINEEQYTRAIEEQKQALELRLGVADMSIVSAERIAQVREVAARAGLSEEQKRLAVQIAIVEAKERENQAWRRANPEMAKAVDYAEQFAQSMVQVALGSGDISSAMKSLSATLASDAVRSFFKGELLQAGLQAIGAAITAVAGKLLEGSRAGNIFAEAMERVNAFEQRRISATFGETLESKLAVFELRAQQERFEELKRGGNTMFALEGALAAERKQLIDDFNREVAEKEKAAYQERLRVEEERLRAEEAINQRRRSFDDRLFAATVDLTTLAGQLAAFDRQARRDREEEQKAGGEAMVNLEAAQARERLNLQRDFNAKSLEETKRLAQEKLDAETRAARKIVDYLNQINVGTDSALSPTQRLSAAQLTYNSVLALAQGGNADALDRITSDAESLRRALRDVYASSAAFQSGWQTIQNQLLGLPVVAQSVDPVVTAVRDAIIEIKKTTDSVDDTTTAVTVDTAATAFWLTQTVIRLDTTTHHLVEAVQIFSEAVDKLTHGNALLDAIEGFTNRTINAINALGSLFASFARDAHDQGQIQIDRLEQLAHLPPSGGSSGTIWEWFGFQRGGVVGAYAPGGIVGNGMTNVDSVLARYAAGGSIALAGGEGVINQPATAAIGGRATIDFINQHRVLPANDNGAIVAELRALRQQLAVMEQRLVRAEAIAAEHVAAPLNKMCDAIEDQGREQVLVNQAA